MDNNHVEEHDFNRRRYYRRSLGERTPLIELITVCYCIVATATAATVHYYCIRDDEELKLEGLSPVIAAVILVTTTIRVLPREELKLRSRWSLLMPRRECTHRQILRPNRIEERGIRRVKGT